MKSFKRHLKKVAGDVKMSYEELNTVLTQIEACLNSRPLAPMIAINGEGVEALTPGHFLAGRPLCALPDREINPQPSHLLRRWQLCQQITQSAYIRKSRFLQLRSDPPNLSSQVRRVFHKADGPHPGLHAEVLWDSEYSTSSLTQGG